MSARWDDPGPVHADTCSVHNSDYPCSCGAELDRLYAIEAAAVALVAKAADHELRGWGRIALGAFAPLREALHGSLTTAVRLDALLPVELGCDEDVAS